MGPTAHQWARLPLACPTAHKHVRSHARMWGHTRTRESRHTHESRHFPRDFPSHGLHQKVLSNIQINHDSRKRESWHTCIGVTSHTHAYASRHTHESRHMLRNFLQPLNVCTLSVKTDFAQSRSSDICMYYMYILVVQKVARFIHTHKHTYIRSHTHACTSHTRLVAPFPQLSAAVRVMYITCIYSFRKTVCRELRNVIYKDTNICMHAYTFTLYMYVDIILGTFSANTKTQIYMYACVYVYTIHVCRYYTYTRHLSR